MTTPEQETMTLMEQAELKAKYPRHFLSSVWGDMPDDEFRHMVEDFKERPRMMMINLYEDQVLDGWHRYMMVLAADLPKIQVAFNPIPEDADPVGWVIVNNNNRRHNTSSQRAGIIVALRKWATDGQHGSSTLAETFTARQMAEQANVAVSTIEDAKTAERGGLGEAVRSGEMSAKAAAGEVRAQERPEPEPIPEEEIDTDLEADGAWEALAEEAEAAGIENEEEPDFTGEVTRPSSRAYRVHQGASGDVRVPNTSELQDGTPGPD